MGGEAKAGFVLRYGVGDEVGEGEEDLVVLERVLGLDRCS